MFNSTKKGAALAAAIGDALFEAHRGAYVHPGDGMILPDGVAQPGDLVAFGNDGHGTDERSRREVEALAGWAAGRGLVCVHHGLSGDSYTWAAVLRPREGKADAALAAEAVDVLW